MNKRTLKSVLFYFLLYNYFMIEETRSIAKILSFSDINEFVNAKMMFTPDLEKVMICIDDWAVQTYKYVGKKELYRSIDVIMANINIFTIKIFSDTDDYIETRLILTPNVLKNYIKIILK